MKTVRRAVLVELICAGHDGGNPAGVGAFLCAGVRISYRLNLHISGCRLTR